MDEVTKNLAEAADGFKKMQYALLICSSLVAIALILVSIALIKQNGNT